MADFLNLEDGDELTIELPAADVVLPTAAPVAGVAPQVRLAVGGGLADGANRNMKWTLTWRSPGGTSVSGRFNHAGDRVILGTTPGPRPGSIDAAENRPLIMLKDHYDKVRYAGFSSV